MNIDHETAADSSIVDDMPATMNCPVCRAGQQPNLVCRRCGADLDLYLACLSSQRRAARMRQAALESGDKDTALHMEAYLSWLTGKSR